jgi:transcriptional regulator with XRE-family HTH domain
MRVQRGLTLTAVGKELGVTRVAVYYYEIGHRMPRDAVKVKLALLYGKSVLELFYPDMEQEQTDHEKEE